MLRWRWILVLAALLVAVAAGLVVLSSDVPLSDPAREAMRAPERLPPRENLFNAVVGFAAGPEHEPADAGHAAVSRVNALLGSAREGADPEAVRRVWSLRVLRIEDPSGVLCSARAPGCLARLADRAGELRALAQRNEVLLARYRSLASHPRYRNELVGHVATPLPPFHDLAAAHRLWLGLRLADGIEGSPGAVGAVARDLRFLRRMLAQANMLLSKMVAASLTADSAHLLAALMDVAGADPSAFPRLAPLSAGERSLEAALAGEFRLTSASARSIDHRRKMAADLGIPERLGAPLLRPLYKPNRTLNAAWRCLAEAREHAARPAEKLLAAGTPAGWRHCTLPWTEWVLNPVGAVLIAIAMPDYTRQAVRLHDLDGLLTLVNLKRAIRSAGVGERALADFLAGEGARFTGPYDGRPATWDRARGVLRFESPASDGGLAALPLAPLDAAR